MWFESLPSLAILCASLALPNIVMYATNKLFLGNEHKRSLYYKDDYHVFLRDTRLSGDPYKQIGLEGLSFDEDKEH